MKKSIAISFFFLTVFGLAGCQTIKQNGSGDAVISASQWLKHSALTKIDNRPMSAREIAYVLRKIGFEPSPSDVSEWIGKPRQALTHELLTSLKTTPIVERPSWVNLEPRYWGHIDWSPAKRSAFRSARKQEISQLRQWWVKQMLASDSPFGERLVLFWENTFVAGFRGLDSKSHAQWMHHNAIRKYATGHYRDLILAMIRDPAVLIYLDNNRNKKGSPNENLAREFLELFTLGESNYSEEDVKESARALAGWHVSEFGRIKFQEKSWARDFGEKTIFNKRGDFDGEDLVDLILSHPKSAEFVVRRVWREFVSLDPIPQRVLQHWSDGFRKTGYHIKALLEIMLNSTYFWDEQYRGTSVKSPIELLVGILRASQTNKISLATIDSSLSNMGQRLFDPSDVSGWGYGEYWLDPAKLIERENFQNRVARLLSEDESAENNTKGGKGSVMSNDQNKQKSSDGFVTIKLAGEAYKGPPPYSVYVWHAEGIWKSERRYLKSARDTERFGRYTDESQWVWETVSLKLPEKIKNIEAIAVHFLEDAAGNDGDRNLFIGSIEWDGLAIDGSMGKQSPGCKNQTSLKRHPGRLYCRGYLKVDWKDMKLIKEKRKNIDSIDSVFATNELVLTWLTPPKKSGYQNIDLMFDGLKFKNRRWDYFGFKLILDTKEGRNWYSVGIEQDRCFPSCFQRWPISAWTDKSGKKGVNVFFNNHKEWALEQFAFLSREDKNLVKAIISIIPKVKELVLKTKSHRENDSRKVWLKRMATFIDYSKGYQWRNEKPFELVELNPNRENTGAMEPSIGMRRTGSMSDQVSYTIFPEVVESKKHWHHLHEKNLKLASEPLESWMLSIYEGERLTSLDQVVASPYLNIK